MILHIGVKDDISEPVSDLTTYQVGKIIEAEYGLFSQFYELNKQFIGDEVAKHIVDMPLQESMGAPATGEIFLDAVRKKLQTMLETRQFDGLLSGVPTKAALTGYSRIKKKGSERASRRRTKTTKTSRPSFIDSGTLKNDLTVWVD